MEFDHSTDTISPDDQTIITIGGTNGVTANVFLPVVSGSNPAYAEGKIFYDNTEKAVSYYNDNSGVTVNLGRESLLRVYNATGTSIVNGRVVYINGANSGAPTIALAQANAVGTGLACGVVTADIANGAFGYVTFFGIVHNMDTSAYTAGALLYLSAASAGLLTATQPTSPNLAVPLAYCLVSNASTGQLLVLPRQNINTSGGGGGGVTMTIDDTAPASPTAGVMWLRPSDGVLSIYVPTSTGFTWVAAQGAQGPAGANGVDTVLGGANTQILYNNGGTSAGDSTFTFNNSTKAVNATALDLAAGTTAQAPLTVPHGVAPTAPNNGDIWTTTTGMFIRTNGVTQGVIAGDELTYNTSTNAMTFAGAVSSVNLTSQGGYFQLQSLASGEYDATGTDGLTRLYAKNIAGKVHLKVVGNAGDDRSLQPHIGFNNIALISPGTGTTVSNFGGVRTTAINTIAHPTRATTNFKTQMRRFTGATTATAGTFGGIRTTAAEFWRGTAAGQGGFLVACRFGIEAQPASGGKWFVGLNDNSAQVNADQSTATTPGKMGMSAAANSGNWVFCTNITGTAPTVTTLGSNFPIDTTTLYELVLYCPPNASYVGWRVRNLINSAEASGTITTNLPAAATQLYFQAWGTNNTTAAATTVITISRIYMEIDT